MSAPSFQNCGMVTPSVNVRAELIAALFCIATNVNIEGVHQDSIAHVAVMIALVLGPIAGIIGLVNMYCATKEKGLQRKYSKYSYPEPWS